MTLKFCYSHRSTIIMASSSFAAVRRRQRSSLAVCLAVHHKER